MPSWRAEAWPPPAKAAMPLPQWGHDVAVVEGVETLVTTRPRLMTPQWGHDVAVVEGC